MIMHHRRLTDFFRPKMVLVRDLSLGFFSGVVVVVVCFGAAAAAAAAVPFAFPPPSHPLPPSSAYLGL